MQGLLLLLLPGAHLTAAVAGSASSCASSASTASASFLLAGLSEGSTTRQARPAMSSTRPGMSSGRAAAGHRQCQRLLWQPPGVALLG